MRSEAQKRADKKYSQSDKCKYKTISVRLRIEQSEKIQSTAEQNGMTLSKYVLNCALYCIENNVVFNLSEDSKKD